MLKDIQRSCATCSGSILHYANDPLLAERIHAALMSGVEQVEMELRRKVDETTATAASAAPAARPSARLRRRRGGILRKLSKSK